MDAPEYRLTADYDKPTEFALSDDELPGDKKDALHKDLEDTTDNNDSADDTDNGEKMDPMTPSSSKTKTTTATKAVAGKARVADATAGSPGTGNAKKGKAAASVGKLNKGKAVASTGAKRKLEIPSGVGLSGEEHENPWENIPHPTKKSKKTGEPLKKPLSKAEKDAKSAWEQGKRDMLELRDTKVAGENKKISQTIIDKVCFAIQLVFPDSARAQAHIPKEEQSLDSYQQSTRGRKPQLDGMTREDLVEKIRTSHQRDRRYAWQAVRTSSFCNSLGSLSEKQRLVRNLMEIFNERYRHILWESHGIAFGDIPGEKYYLGTDKFLKIDMQLEDGIDTGRTFPIVTTTAPAMIAATVTTTAASTIAGPSTAPMATNAAPATDEEVKELPEHIVDLGGSDDLDSGEKNGLPNNAEKESVEDGEVVAETSLI